MSIKGTDLQIMIWRSPEAGKIQQAQKVGEFAEQQNFAGQLTKQAELAGSTIQNLPRAEQGKINSDESKKEKQALQKREGVKKEQQDIEELIVPSGNIIDYKI